MMDNIQNNNTNKGLPDLGDLTTNSGNLTDSTNSPPVNPSISNDLPNELNNNDATDTLIQNQPNTGTTYDLPPLNNTQPTKLSMDFLLNYVIDNDASDLHLSVAYPPMVRVDGKLQTVGDTILTPQMIKDLVYSILPDQKREILEVNKEVDLAYAFGDKARFRVNVYHVKGSLSAALRLIPNRIRSIEELHLPELYKEFADLEQGFVLVTGPTGHGKSTTLAAIIQEINLYKSKHILTIEDPIEYVFPPAKALVTQREMGQDTNSWKIALRSALREDPDVVLIGEMRDYETIAAAITIAETGHLVFATLHTNSASQTIDRIINVFPSEQQNEVRAQLANVLKVVIAQRLIPVHPKGRRAVAEVMIANDAISNLIREGKIYQIDNIIRTSSEKGMITLERSLIDLVNQGLITVDEAKQYAVNPEEIDRMLKPLS